MAHGGYGKHRVAGKRMHENGGGSKGLGVKRPLDKTRSKKKTKVASIKNQIRAVERLLKKNLPAEARDVQKKRLEDLKEQAEEHHRSELERKMSLRYRRVKFFERRKIERRIKRLEKLLEGTDNTDGPAMKENPDITKQLAQLKEDLEYVRFFPRTEKYVSLFMGNEDEEVVAKRSKLREQIKANLAAAAALGVEPEEMDNEEQIAMAVSDDDFFLAGSSSDDEDADHQLVHTSSKSGRIQTLKNTAKASTNLTLGHKKQQHHKILQNPGSGSKNYKQRPVSMFRNKGSWQDDQRRSSIGADNKSKFLQKFKKAKFGPPSSVSLSHSIRQEARSQPASTSALKIASSVISSKTNAGYTGVPSHVSKDAMKTPKVSEVGSSSMDVQKKRRRKHRPKKKKS